MTVVVQMAQILDEDDEWLDMGPEDNEEKRIFLERKIRDAHENEMKIHGCAELFIASFGKK